MSASEELTTIYTTDSSEKVREKITKHAFSGGQPTQKLQRKLGGNPDTDVSFQYMKMLFEPDDKKLAEIESDYRSGRLLTSELKEMLIEKITRFLEQHQKAREKATEKIEEFIYKD